MRRDTPCSVQSKTQISVLSGGSAMTNQLVSAVMVAVVALVASSAVWAQRAPAPVVVAKAKVMAVSDTVQLPGTVVASRTAKLSSAIGGLVKSVSVDFGDRVKSGDTVVALDNAQAQLVLEQAKAAVQEAQANLTEKRRLLRVGRNLTRRGVLTKNQADTRRAEVLIAQAGLKRLLAVQASALDSLNRHRIVAPFAGVIAEKFVESGEWVSPGTAIVELIANQDVLVDVSLPQKYFSQLSDQTRFALTIDAIPGRTVMGQRAALSPVSDPTMRTFKLRVSLPADVNETMPGIAPGMSAQVTLTLTSDAQSVVVPRDSVVRKAGGRTTVWVAQMLAGDDGFATVTEKTVRIGNSFDENVVVFSGLKAIDRVVVSGNESLREKQKVRITRVQ